MPNGTELPREILAAIRSALAEDIGPGAAETSERGQSLGTDTLRMRRRSKFGKFPVCKNSMHPVQKVDSEVQKGVKTATKSICKKRKVVVSNLGKFLLRVRKPLRVCFQLIDIMQVAVPFSTFLYAPEKLLLSSSWATESETIKCI